MLVEGDYKDHRIQVDAELVDGVWNARIRIRRTFSEEKAYVETVTCRKATAQLVEERAVISALVLGGGSRGERCSRRWCPC